MSSAENEVATGLPLRSLGKSTAEASRRADHLLHADLKLRHLRLLLALDEERKLQRAAQTLAISQPAASRMLGDIERIAGVSLFERLPRGLEANAFGEALIRRAHRADRA